jgi:DNA-binding transcriptional MocR family regulator
MSLRRRQALIEFARARGAVIIEDDYDGEFRYEGSPLPALPDADPKRSCRLHSRRSLDASCPQDA